MIYPNVLIVILNYRTYELTLSLIAEIRKLTYPNVDVMVVDNCSPNESAQILNETAQKENFIFYANNSNAGYAAGNNIGIRYAISHEYSYTWILNNDIKFRDYSILEKLVEAAETKDNVGCVGPKIYSLEGIVCAPYCDRPTLWSMTLGIVTARYKRKKRMDVSGEVYRVFGCCMLLNNKIMDAIDCMDERTFLYREEDILAERMRNINAVSYYCATTSITHMESMTVKKTNSSKKWNRLKITIDSMEIYLRDYRHFNVFSRFLCEFIRCLVIYLRG